jgi:hypothetical protein
MDLCLKSLRHSPLSACKHALLLGELLIEIKEIDFSKEFTWIKMFECVSSIAIVIIIMIIIIIITPAVVIESLDLDVDEGYLSN